MEFFLIHRYKQKKSNTIYLRGKKEVKIAITHDVLCTSQTFNIYNDVGSHHTRNMVNLNILITSTCMLHTMQ